MNIKRYGSATEITKANGTAVLVSYSTPVAAFVPGQKGAMVAQERYSRTTSRHVAEFCKRHGLTPREVPQSDIAALLEGC